MTVKERRKTVHVAPPLLGRLTDRTGILTPMLLGIALIGIGYVASGLAPSLWALSAFLVVGGPLVESGDGPGSWRQS